MGETLFVRDLDERSRIRVAFETRGKDVLWFVAQLEVCIKDDWQAVVRYDTAHGFAHRDELYPDGSVNKVELNMDFAAALTFAQRDMQRNYEVYLARWLRKSKHE